MAYAMTKCGSLDNCVTYEFICDTVADMNAIENRYRTMGSVAVVIEGNAGFEVYMANSQKQWVSLVISSTEEEGEGEEEGQSTIPDSAVALEDGTVLTDESGNVIGVDEPTI